MVVVTDTRHVVTALHVQLRAKTSKQRRLMGFTVTDELDRRLGVLFRVYYDTLRRLQVEYGLHLGIAVVEGISRGPKGRQPDSRSTQAAGVIKAVAFSLGRPIYSASVNEVRTVLNLKGPHTKEARFLAAAQRYQHTCIAGFDWTKSEHTCDALALAEVGLNRLATLEDYIGYEEIPAHQGS
jgi:hypothetical protein